MRLLATEPALRRLVGARAPATALVALGAIVGSLSLAYMTPPPPSLAAHETDGRLAISHVAIGSAWWARGLRPGMAAEWLEGGPAAEPSFMVLVGDAAIDVNLDGPERDPGSLVIAGLAMAVGLVMGRLGLPGRPMLLVISAAVAAAPWYPELGLPLALPLACLPVLVAWLGVEPRSSLSSRRLNFAASLAIAAVVAGGLLLMSGPSMSGPPVMWTVVWLFPSLAAFVVQAGGTALTTLDELSGTGLTRPTGRHEVVRHLIPMARESRLDGLESERRRVAEEVHDDLLPRLAASIRTLDVGDHDSSVATLRLREVSDSLRHLMNGRQLVELELGGLTAALESHVRMRQRDGVPIALAMTGDDQRPPLAVELSVYRIAQAAIENSITHSDASLIEVSLRTKKGAVDLTIRDDGTGMASTRAIEALRDGRVGLGEMHQRSSQLGARLTITSRTPSGTEVRFRWPK